MWQRNTALSLKIEIRGVGVHRNSGVKNSTLGSQGSPAGWQRTSYALTLYEVEATSKAYVTAQGPMGTMHVTSLNKSTRFNPCKNKSIKSIFRLSWRAFWNTSQSTVVTSFPLRTHALRITDLLRTTRGAVDLSACHTQCVLTACALEPMARFCLERTTSTNDISLRL